MPVTGPFTAALTALAAMGARRIALLTPYVDEVNQGMRRAIVAGSLDAPVMGSFNFPDDNAVARISEASIEDALVELASDPAVDAAERVESRSRHRITPSPGIACGLPGSGTRSTGSAASSGHSSRDSRDVSSDLPQTRRLSYQTQSHQSAGSYLNEMSRRTR